MNRADAFASYVVGGTANAAMLRLSWGGPVPQLGLVLWRSGGRRTGRGGIVWPSYGPLPFIVLFYN